MNWTLDGSLELQNLDVIGNGKRICMIDCDDDTVSDYDHMANAQLIAAAPDLKALQADFSLQGAPEKDGLQWVQATPKAKDGQLLAVRVGLRSTDKGSELAVLDILDSFGQRSVMSFSNLQVNAPLPSDAFQFRPPAGADVIRQ